ncbi:MAG TPA: hypothetical protein VN673_04575, partial [Clostridia bacterium]|nr:hypothetical protein [Clostridia bacterium]
MKDIGSYGMDVAWTRGQSWAVVLVLVLLFVRNGYGARSHTVQHDIPKATVTMADGQSNLVLRLNLNDRCVIDRMIVRGRDVGAPGLAAYTGVCVSNQWHTSSALTSKPVLKLTRNKVTVSGIRADCGGIEFSESWQFTLLEDRIVWEITRTGAKEVLVDDAGLPVLQFQNMQTWAGAMLDHGGVAWNRYLETPNASYASDTAEATFWNREHKDCLRVRTEGRFAPTAVAQGKAFRRNPAEGGRPLNVSTRFSHQPSKLHTAVFSLSQAPFRPRHGQHRFHASRQDVWAPVRVPAGTTVATVSFQALDYEAAYDRGSFAGLNGGNIRELMNTIGRYGVIDRRLVGANGWRTGFICLHEQWFSQMGIALADLAYIQNCAATYDYERDHAILENGRVKARWYYGVGDAMPGTYDSRGFYEAQWGYLMDSQPCYAICVAEQFDLTGDLAWL